MFFSELIGVARIFSVQLKVHSHHHLHHRDNHADKLLKGSLSFLKLAAVSRKFHSSLKKGKNEKKIYKVSKKLETVFFSKDLKSSIFKFNEMISIQFEQFLFRGIKNENESWHEWSATAQRFRGSPFASSHRPF